MRNEQRRPKVLNTRAKFNTKLDSYWHVDLRAYQRLLDDYNAINKDQKEIETYY